MFGGTFSVLLIVFSIIMMIYTTEGKRFYREYIKKYINMIFNRTEYDYNA